MPHLTQVRIQTSFILKVGRGLVVANLLLLESLLLAAVHVS